MDCLWAPWRMEFIRGHREGGCIFCRLPGERAHLRENLILHLGAKAFVILNRYPYNCGHLMVIPLRHTNDFLSLTPEENAEMALLLQRSMKILEEIYHPEGFNLGMNLGLSAGAGIREHLHHHLLPRWLGDTNFLPALSQTRSMPEMLLETYDRLRPRFQEAESNGEIAAGGDPASSLEERQP
jgi:ATP adenylyltransferase